MIYVSFQIKFNKKTRALIIHSNVKRIEKILRFNKFI